MGKSISKGLKSIAKSVTGGFSAGGGASVPLPVAAPPVALPDDTQQPVVETLGEDSEKTPSRAIGKSGLNISRTSGGGLSI